MEFEKTETRSKQIQANHIEIKANSKQIQSKANPKPEKTKKTYWSNSEEAKTIEKTKKNQKKLCPRENASPCSRSGPVLPGT